MKKTYRIEIKSKTLPGKVFVFFIGANLDLVPNYDDAVPCTHEEHIAVMERIQCEATAYDATKVKGSKEHENPAYPVGDSVCGWDVKNYAQAEKLAAEMSAKSGLEYLPIDRGQYHSPRFFVTRMFKVGEEVTKAFNGDAYPIGKVVSVSASKRVVTVQRENGEKLRFYRHRNGEGWYKSPWYLCHGSFSRYNREL